MYIQYANSIVTDLKLELFSNEWFPFYFRNGYKIQMPYTVLKITEIILTLILKRNA